MTVYLYVNITQYNINELVLYDGMTESVLLSGFGFVMSAINILETMMEEK